MTKRQRKMETVDLARVLIECGSPPARFRQVRSGPDDKYVEYVWDDQGDWMWSCDRANYVPFTEGEV